MEGWKTRQRGVLKAGLPDKELGLMFWTFASCSELSPRCAGEDGRKSGFACTLKGVTDVPDAVVHGPRSGLAFRTPPRT